MVPRCNEKYWRIFVHQWFWNEGHHHLDVSMDEWYHSCPNKDYQIQESVKLTTFIEAAAITQDSLLPSECQVKGLCWLLTSAPKSSCEVPMPWGMPLLWYMKWVFITWHEVFKLLEVFKSLDKSTLMKNIIFSKPNIHFKMFSKFHLCKAGFGGISHLP